MKQNTLFTDNIMVDDFNKPLYFLNSDQLNVSNLISPDDLGFFYKYYRDFFTEIVYYKYDMPLCPDCGNSMNSNGFKVTKLNKWENIRKKTVYLSSLW